MAKICKRCGSKLDSATGLCPFCDKKQLAVQHAHQIKHYNRSSINHHKENLVVPIVVVAMIIFLIIGTVTVILISSNTGQNQHILTNTGIHSSSISFESNSSENITEIDKKNNPDIATPETEEMSKTLDISSASPEISTFPNSSPPSASDDDDKASSISQAGPVDLIDICPPYESEQYEAPTTFYMAGEMYSRGFILDSTGDGSLALFNLGGKYDTLEFDLGHIDQTGRHDATIEIYLDGEISQIIEAKADALPQHITVNLHNAFQMKITVRNGSHYISKWGFANTMLYPDPTYVKPVRTPISNQWLVSVCPPYESEQYEAPTTFYMAGEMYSRGFILDSTGDGSLALFNLGGEYDTLEFDLGHIDQTGRYDATIEIYLDGEISQIIEAKTDALPQHITIDLHNALQMKITVRNGSHYISKWGFANAAVW